MASGVLKYEDFEDGVPYCIRNKDTGRVCFIVGREDNHVYIPNEEVTNTRDHDGIYLPELLACWEFAAKFVLDKEIQYFPCSKDGLKGMEDYLQRRNREEKGI